MEKFTCIPTDQGTGTPETCLCSICADKRDNVLYARKCARSTNDINPNGEFVDCSENTALECCICGKRIVIINGKSGDILSFQDVIDDIANVLEAADGEYVTEIHNQICSDTIIYESDSIWKRS